MEKYIALLRGVNVGGRNKISMPELKTAFEKNGYSDVMTYINSGNVIFTNELTDEEQLGKQCARLISDAFQMEIPVAIISVKDLSEAMENAPLWWNTGTDAKHNAIFVIPPATAEDICAQVGEIKPEYEKADYYGGVIFWSAPLKTFSKTRWSKVVGSPVYDSITIRNANTANKLLQLAK